MKQSNQVTRIPSFIPTAEQREWMEREKARTGNPFSVILKQLIQEKINGK